jgi:uncharacterized coiled-coil protein SlyX
MQLCWGNPEMQLSLETRSSPASCLLFCLCASPDLTCLPLPLPPTPELPLTTLTHRSCLQRESLHAVHLALAEEQRKAVAAEHSVRALTAQLEELRQQLVSQEGHSIAPVLPRRHPAYLNLSATSTFLIGHKIILSPHLLSMWMHAGV